MQMISEHCYENNFYSSLPGVPGLHFENCLLIWGRNMVTAARQYRKGRSVGAHEESEGSAPEAHVAVRIRVPMSP